MQLNTFRDRLYPLQAYTGHGQSKHSSIQSPLTIVTFFTLQILQHPFIISNNSTFVMKQKINLIKHFVKGNTKQSQKKKEIEHRCMSNKIHSFLYQSRAHCFSSSEHHHQTLNPNTCLIPCLTTIMRKIGRNLTKIVATGRNVMRTEVINKVKPNEKNILPCKVVFRHQCTGRNRTKMEVTNQMPLSVTMSSNQQ